MGLSRGFFFLTHTVYILGRYGIQNFTTETGFRGFLGVICQPGTFSGLELGYVVLPGSKACHPVQEVDLPLWAHGEGGEQPRDFGFRFKAAGEWHDMQVRIVFASQSREQSCNSKYSLPHIP